MKLTNTVGTGHLADDLDGLIREISSISTDQQCVVFLQGFLRQCVEVTLDEVLHVVRFLEYSNLFPQARSAEFLSLDGLSSHMHNLDNILNHFAHDTIYKIRCYPTNKCRQLSQRLLLQYMNNQGDIREQFLKAEASVGITRANFNKRFVYQGQAADSYLLQRYTPSPSQLQGFTIQQEKGIGYLMSQLIFRAAESLKLPVSTSIVAASIAHYFYSRVGLLDHDFRDVAMGAVFLACKCEQTLRRSYEVSSVFDFVFKVFEGQRAPIKVQVLQSTQYEFMRKKVLHMENQILFEEGFEVFRLFDIPHRYIGGLFKAFDRHPQSRRIIQTAWAILNDFYRTNCVIHFPGQCIAAAAVYLSLVRLGIKLPSVAWWILLECNLESIEELLGQLQCLYEASSRYSMEWAAAQINEVAHRQQLVNVFPVNYYRKIMLELSSQLKITALPPQPSQPPQPQQAIQEEDSRERSRERKKKKSKKDKKDKKKKKRKHSSESRSQEKDRRSSNSKEIIEMNKLSIRNNDETPKMKQEQDKMKDENQEREARQESQVKQKESKQAVKQMQVGSAKGLLSLISSQLKMRENKRQKQPQEEAQLPSKAQDSDSDEQLMAELIQIRKSRRNQ